MGQGHTCLRTHSCVCVGLWRSLGTPVHMSMFAYTDLSVIHFGIIARVSVMKLIVYLHVSIHPHGSLCMHKNANIHIHAYPYVRLVHESRSPCLSLSVPLFLLLMLASPANPTQGPWPLFWWRAARKPGNTDSARPNRGHSSRVWFSHP